MIVIGANDLWFLGTCTFILIGLVFLLVVLLAPKNIKKPKESEGSENLEDTKDIKVNKKQRVFSVVCLIIPLFALLCIVQLNFSIKEDNVSWKTGAEYNTQVGLDKNNNTKMGTLTLNNGKGHMSGDNESEDFTYTENNDGTLSCDFDGTEVKITHYPIEDVLILTPVIDVTKSDKNTVGAIFHRVEKNK